MIVVVFYIDFRNESKCSRCKQSANGQLELVFEGKTMQVVRWEEVFDGTLCLVASRSADSVFSWSVLIVLTVRNFILGLESYWSILFNGFRKVRRI